MRAAVYILIPALIVDGASYDVPKVEVPGTRR